MQASTLTRLFLPILLLLAGCGDIEKARINEMLDARDLAVSNRDIDAYSRLLLHNYQYHGQTKGSVIGRMIRLFDQFDETRMQSFDRNIVLLDGEHAQCEQSYHLKVRLGDRWREITQREQLYLIRTDAGWRISGGL